jgi:quercetin dioxygenase-like cupin family protein
MSDVITFRVTSAQSAGQVCVVDLIAPPGGGPPPLHSHPSGEVFTVLEGQVSIYRGDPTNPSRSELATGDVAYVPGGEPHTFRNLTEKPARLMLTFVPGATMEQFFLQAGVPVVDPDDPPRLDLASEVQRVFRVGAELGLQQFDPHP